MAEELSQLAVKISADQRQFQRQMNEVQSTLTKMQRRMQQTGKSGNDSFKLIGAAAGAFLGGQAAQEILHFGKQVLETRGEFQKLEAVLTNTLGSQSKAQIALKQIQEFAARTPFQVQGLTASFVKLANQGFTPNVNQLRQLGDLASSTGKDFDQLAEAMLDAQVGEFERLKEFGIRARKEGDQVKFTFKGVETQVQNSEAAIRAYILSLGDAQGVTGSMAAVSKTLVGEVSNLGDAYDRLLNNLGKLVDEDGAAALGWMTRFTNALNEGLEQSADPFRGLVNSTGDYTQMLHNLATLQMKQSKQQAKYAEALKNEEWMPDWMPDSARQSSNLREQLVLTSKAVIEQQRVMAAMADEGHQATKVFQEQTKVLRQQELAAKSAFGNISKISTGAQFNQQMGGDGASLMQVPTSLAPVKSQLSELGQLKIQMEKEYGSLTMSQFEFLKDYEGMQNQFMQTAAAGLVTSFAELAGGLAAGSISLKQAGTALLGVFADIASQFGQQLIAFGTAGIAAKALFNNPYTAVVAGAALVAAAAAAKGALSRSASATGSMPGLVGGGGGGGSSIGGRGASFNRVDNSQQSLAIDINLDRLRIALKKSDERYQRVGV